MVEQSKLPLFLLTNFDPCSPFYKPALAVVGTTGRLTGMFLLLNKRAYMFDAMLHLGKRLQA
jgi:hypothetical protein